MHAHISAICVSQAKRKVQKYVLNFSVLSTYMGMNVHKQAIRVSQAKRKVQKYTQNHNFDAFHS